VETPNFVIFTSYRRFRATAAVILTSPRIHPGQRLTSAATASQCAQKARSPSFTATVNKLLPVNMAAHVRTWFDVRLRAVFSEGLSLALNAHPGWPKTDLCGDGLAVGPEGAVLSGLFILDDHFLHLAHLFDLEPAC
jgi:hypothetical protein